jgi:hypothetical protein
MYYEYTDTIEVGFAPSLEVASIQPLFEVASSPSLRKECVY